MFRMKKQEYKEQERHYYFFDYLFWLGEITWEHYHKVSFKQPRGSDMLWACITFFIIVSSVSVFMTDRLFGKIYPPSRRKAVMQHYAGRKFSPFRRNLFFFPLYLLLIPAMVLLGTALKWITEILK